MDKEAKHTNRSINKIEQKLLQEELKFSSKDEDFLW